MVLGCVDGTVFPMMGILISKILVAELKYELDPPYYRSYIYKICGIISGGALGGALIVGFRHMLFVIISESAIRKIKCLIFNKIIAMPLSWLGKE